MSVVNKVIAIRKMRLPDEICEEILTYLFYDIFERTKRKTRELNVFINRCIIRYEDYDTTARICVWGIGFFPYDKFQIQNISCTICGNFMNEARSVLCKCTLSQQIFLG